MIAGLLPKWGFILANQERFRVPAAASGIDRPVNRSKIERVVVLLCQSQVLSRSNVVQRRRAGGLLKLHTFCFRDANTHWPPMKRLGGTGSWSTWSCMVTAS